MIVNYKKDVVALIKTLPEVVESKAAYEEDEPGGFDEVEKVLLGLVLGADGGPEFGTDWDKWLKENIDELLQDAISIVM